MIVVLPVILAFLGGAQVSGVGGLLGGAMAAQTTINGIAVDYSKLCPELDLALDVAMDRLSSNNPKVIALEKIGTQICTDSKSQGLVLDAKLIGDAIAAIKAVAYLLPIQPGQVGVGPDGPNPIHSRLAPPFPHHSR